MQARKIKHNTELFSKEAFDNHIELYENYVKQAFVTSNETRATFEPKHVNKNQSRFRGIKIEQPFLLNSVILHELFFENIGGDSKIGNTFVNFIMRSFEDTDDWLRDFAATAKAARGWCMTCLEQRTGKVMNIAGDTYNEGVVAGAYPVIVLDCYEHSFVPDYGNDIDAYIRKFLHSINWSVVEKRIKNIGWRE